MTDAQPGPQDGQPSTPGAGGTPPPPPQGPWASDNLPRHPMSDVTPPHMDQPQSILTAVRLMWVGAAFGVLGILFTITQTDAMREAIEDSDSSLTASEVDTAVNVGIGATIVFGLIGVGLWLWMAWANGEGKSWARVVAAVLGALNIVSTLFGFATPGASPLNVVLSLVGLALAAAILFLLYRPESSRFYEARSR